MRYEFIVGVSKEFKKSQGLFGSKAWQMRALQDIYEEAKKFRMKIDKLFLCDEFHLRKTARYRPGIIKSPMCIKDSLFERA